MIQETLEQQSQLGLASLSKIVSDVFTMVMADIPVGGIQQSLVDRLRELSIAGSYSLITTEGIVGICRKMEEDSWFRHLIIEATERLAFETALRGIDKQVESSFEEVLRCRNKFNIPENLLDKRVIAGLLLDEQKIKSIRMNQWLLTIYLFCVTGSIHAIAEIGRNKQEQGA